MLATVEKKMLSKALEIRKDDVSLKIWLCLLQRAIDTQNLIVQTSFREIAVEINADPSTTKRRVNKLEELGYIKTRRTQQGSTFEIAL